MSAVVRMEIEIVLHAVSGKIRKTHTGYISTGKLKGSVKPRKFQVHDEIRVWELIRMIQKRYTVGGQTDVRLRVFMSDESCGDMIDARREY